MASVSSLGAGSGLDLNGLLRNLMSVEQQPLVNLQRKEASFQARISALGSLKGALSNLQSSASSLIPGTGQTALDKFATYSASVAESTVASATASSSSVPGVYTLEISKLAQGQRLVTPTPAGVSAYTNADAAIGQGTLTIEFGKLDTNLGTYTSDNARKLTIEITDANDTLGGLRDAINAANGGVTATIVTGTAGAQLVLTGKDTGLKNVMRISGTVAGFDYDPVSNGGNLTQAAAQGGRSAQDAAFTINGIAATSSSNTVTGVLDGVTLTLQKTNVGTPTEIKVSRDMTSAVNTALNALVKSFNEAAKTISSLGAFDEKTKTAGPLQGEAIVRTAQGQLRNLVFGAAGAAGSKYQQLADIGVSFDKSGKLSLDSTKLNKALEADYAGVAKLVSNVGQSFKTSLETMVGTSGTIASVTDNVNRMIKDIGTRTTALNNRLSQVEARYRRQFTALDTAIANMKDTSSRLTQQLATLPGVGSN